MSKYLIPKIIHQTWKVADLHAGSDDVFRQYALKSQASWKTHHPEFEYMFWSDLDMESFVKNHYNWFYPNWKNFDVHIKRVDTARYCWMHYFGGVYCDLDMICKKNIEPLLKGFDVVSYKSKNSLKRSKIFAGNAWMASIKGHSLWIEMLNYTIEHPLELSYKTKDVMFHTGPRALGIVFENHVEKNPDSKIHIWGPDMIGNEDEPPYEYAYHGRTHTWGDQLKSEDQI